jgi:RNA recognition motif-containing protein
MPLLLIPEASFNLIKIMSVRLYVGNLSFDATGDDLNEIFSECGAVEEAIIITRPGGGRPRGFGFVTMSDPEEAADAITQLDGLELAGRALKVNVAKDREESDRDRDEEEDDFDDE